MKVQKLRLSLIISVISISGWACSSPSVDHWIEAVPQSTPALFVLDSSMPVDIALNDPLSVIAAQASSTNNAEILRLVSESGQSGLAIQAMAVIPSNSDEWKPVWILNAPEGTAERASSTYSRPQTANGYNFQGNRIYMLFISESLVLYAIQAGDYLFISESSYALEAFARTISGNEDGLSVSQSELTPGKWFLNLAYMDEFIATETAVRFRPLLNGVFDGSGVANLRFVQNTGGAEISGAMSIEPENSSNMIHAFTNSNHRTIMDRYVSEDAALTAFYHGKARNLPALDEPIELDVYLSTRENERQRFNNTIGNHVAFVAFGSSGFLGASEYAYVRQVERADELRSLLNDWTERGMAQQEGDRYIVDSIVLSWLISGGLAEMGIFHIAFDNDILVATQRPALISKLLTDKERRRTLYYTETYLNARASFPDELSAFIYTKNESLSQFLQPVLNQIQSTGLILDQFDAGALAILRNPGSNSVYLQFKSYQLEQTAQPYDDRWLVRLDGTELAGYPVLADIAGSSRPEVLVSTQGGTVSAIASDGTIVFRVSTGTDIPMGSPIAFDWYANNQMAVIQGAGNKIYGWSNNGSPLPGFPITLTETLSAPIVITDVTRNGIAEIIAATSDRQLHVLNQRGDNINGWPQSLNASIRNKPQVVNWLGSVSIVAYSENVLFAFETNGLVKSGFPLFNRAPFRGEFFIHNDFLITGSADGTVLSIGRGALFPIGTAPIISSPGQSGGQLTTQGVKLAEAGLVVRPEVSTHTIRIDSTNSVTEPVIFALTDAGSLFGINMQGQLRFTQSLGQPALSDHAPIVADIDRNGQSEITGIASFGRMYAWQLVTGERYFDIPTTNLHRPIFADINGNGSNELIAGTQDGLRAWTINR
jgi:hypothetical protein